MSAFTLGSDHIDLLISAAMRIPGFKPQYIDIPKTADKLGQDLLRENFASVNYRYSEEEPVPEYHWAPVGLPVVLEVGHLLQVLQASHCYGYQTCEHPEWTDSRAFWVCQAIELWAERELAARRWPKDAGNPRDGLEYRGIHKMAWEWDREKGFRDPLTAEEIYGAS